jgi:NHLM bacteriocin system ABC transporter peptidase/ATP-binding protein
MAQPVLTPTLLQLEAVECGAAALGIILGHLGRFVPLAELRRRCGVSRSGSTAAKMLLAARSYGLEAKGYTKELSCLRTVAAPYVVFWQFNHFVVVEGLTEQLAYLNDPAKGRRTVPLEEFDAGFTGVVLTFRPGPSFQKGGSPPRLWPNVIGRLRGHGGALTFCVLAGLLAALPMLGVSAFAGVFLDALLEGRERFVGQLIGLLGIVLALQIVLKLTAQAGVRRLLIALEAQFSERFLSHLLRLPLAFYAQRFAGEIAYRMQLNHQAAAVLSDKLTGTAVLLVTLTVYVVVLTSFSPLLSGTLLLAAAANFLALRALTRRRAEQNLRLSQDAGKAAAVAVTGLRAIETVKASGLEPGLFARWAGYYAHFAVALQEVEVGSMALGVLPGLVEALTVTVILVVGGFQVLAGALSLGMLVVFQAVTRNFLGQVSDLVRLGPALQELQACLQRLNDVLVNPLELEGDEVTEADNSATLSTCHLTTLSSKGMEARAVTFAHGPFDPPVLKAVSLRAEPSTRVAVVGSSGAGKSTLARILAGLYAPTSGEVLLGGRPLWQISTEARRHAVGVVDQDVLLFEGTVRDNLTLWDPAVNDEALLRACRDARADDVVSVLPGGLDAVLQEGGTNLSGGQRQRLEIARALVHDPAVLILDEATSALDAETEAAIVDNLRRRGCTLLVMAHRLSTVRDCDEILVLHQGEVVERGTHEQLWAGGGHYARLTRTA